MNKSPAGAKKSASIVVIVVGAIFAVTSAGLGTAGVLAYSALRAQEELELRTLVEVLSEQARTALANPMWNVDPKGIEEAVRSVMKSRQVHSVVVRQAGTREIVRALTRNNAWDAVALEDRHIPTDLLNRECDIAHEGRDIGSVQVFVTSAFLEHRLANTRTALILSLLAFLAILSAVLCLILWHVVLKPVMRLAQYSQQVKTGRIDTFRPPTGSFLGEFGTLRASISEMVGLLQSRYLEVQEQASRLTESEAFRRRVFDSSRIPIVVMDAESYRYIECNAAAVAIYRYRSREEVLGKTPLDVSAPVQYDGTPSPEKARFYIEKAMTEGGVVFEWKHRRPDGEIWDAEVHLMSFESGDRKLLQFTLLDITERKKAEEAFQMSEAKYHTLFDVASDAIFLLEDCVFAECNQRTIEMFGAGRDRILGHAPDHFSPPQQPDGRDSREKAMEKMCLALEGKPQSFEWLHCRGDGTLFDAEVTLTRIEYLGRTQLLAIVRDITDRKRNETRIRQSEERFSKVFMASPDAIVIARAADAVIIDVNPGFTAITGYTREEAVGRATTAEGLDLIAEPQRRAALVDKLAATGEINGVEMLYRVRGGRLITGQISARIVEIGGERCILTVMRDITEKKKMEDALRASEEKSRSYIENAPDGVLIVDSAKNIIEVNAAWCRITGYSRDHVGELTLRDIAAKESLADGKAHFERIFATGAATADLWHVRRDGAKRCFTVDAVKLSESRALAFVKDITERKVMEAALQESELKFRAIFENSRDAIGVAKNGKHVFSNPAYRTLFGFDSDEELIGTSLVDRFVPDERSRIVQNMRNRAAGMPVPDFYESRCRRKDGTEFDMNLKVATFELEGEKYSVGIIRDITERKQAERSMQEARHLYESIFQLSPDMIVVTTQAEGRYLAVNDAHERITGYRRDEVIGHTVAEFTSWVLPEERRKMLDKVREQGCVYNKEVQFYRKSGEIFTGLFSAVFVEVNAQQCVVSMVTDITERKQVEDALRVSEERFRRLLESVTSYVYTVDIRDGECVATRHNPGCIGITGYPPESFAGDPHLWIRMVYDEDRARVVASVEEVLREAVSVTFEHRIVRRDGSLRWVSATLVPHTDEHGILLSYDGLISDITERKTAEDALLESEDRFRQMAENIEEIFFLYQKEGNKLLYMSPVMTVLFGVGLDTIKADPQMIDRAVHPDDAPRVKFTDRQTFYSTPLNEEFRVITPAGAVRWIRLRSFLIRDGRGEVVRVAGLAADVTAYKDAQEQTRQQQLQLIQADKMASLGVMVSGIAHEINNPNNFITMSMPLLRQAWEAVLPVIEEHRKRGGVLGIGSMDFEEFAKNFNQLMDGIADGSQRIKRIVADLKDYARMDAVDMNRVFDLNDMVQAAVNLMNNMIRKRTRAFSLNTWPQRLPVKGNPQRLEQVIVNLIHNACDALTSTDQAISMATEARADGRSALVVSDKGCGMSRDVLSKVFDPFFTTKREAGGTGLGLSISAGIVKDHGGELQFQSEPGKGTTVTLLLPTGAHA